MLSIAANVSGKSKLVLLKAECWPCLFFLHVVRSLWSVVYFMDFQKDDLKFYNDSQIIRIQS